MFCKYCGKEIEDNSAFCKYCGKSLTDDSGNENRSNAGGNAGNNTENARTTYQQRNVERMQQSENAQWDKVLAQNFNTDSNRGVIMATSYHRAMMFPAQILIIITGVFVIVMSFIVLASYRPHRALYAISWILFIAAQVTNKEIDESCNEKNPAEFRDVLTDQVNIAKQ